MDWELWVQPLTLPLGCTGIKHPINARNPRMTENILASVERPSAKITFDRPHCKAQAQPCDLGGSGGPWAMPQEQHNLSCVSVALSLPQGGREGSFQAGAGDRAVCPVRQRVPGGRGSH